MCDYWNYSTRDIIVLLFFNCCREENETFVKLFCILDRLLCNLREEIGERWRCRLGRRINLYLLIKFYSILLVELFYFPIAVKIEAFVKWLRILINYRDRLTDQLNLCKALSTFDGIFKNFRVHLLELRYALGIRKWYRIVQYLYLCRSDKSITRIAVSIIYNVFLTLLFTFIARALYCKSRTVYILLFPRYHWWRQRCFTTLISTVAQSTYILCRVIV